ncbi:hypothetical protein ACJMK2_004582 [Sinanodonta woodiana]|uniref:TIR domain-containing protein n=1 Tax=Sinanodonta woodiana TaxID=1069815 RepID=A0ABD3Y1M0_SINWO
MGTSASVPSSNRQSDILKEYSKIDQSQKHEINSGPSQSDHSGVEKEHNEVEQVKDSRENAFQLYNTALDNIRKIYGGKDNNKNWINDLFENLICVHEVYEAIGQLYSFAYDVALRYRREAGKTMCETQTTKVIMDVVIDCWRACDISKDDPDVINTMKLMGSAISVLWNFSDSTPDVSCEIVNEQNFIEILKTILTSPKLSMDTVDNIANEYKHFIKGALAIIYNVSQVDQTISSLRRHGIVTTITPYLDAGDDEIRLITLATLANIIDEEQSEVLKDKHDALKRGNHNYKGWTAKECGLCVRRLARNDANKKPLVEMGCLHQLVKLAMGKTIEEQREAVGAIWVLAFDKDNQAKILENTELQIIELLVKLKDTSLDKEVRKAADSTLWILREQLQNHDKYKHIATYYIKKNIPNSTEEQKTEELVVQKKTGHVMISYNWGHQKELIKISDILREKGFPVWMDIKNMGGSTLQDMAEAVENASVVLVCYSRKYKDSPNCRAEAEYAFEERKEIIPLKMEADYKRDGWLAMVITGKKFIDFTGKYPFEKKIEELCQRLASNVANEDSETIKSQATRKTTTITKQADDVADGGPVIESSQTISYSAPKTPITSLRQWTSADVDNWINKHSLPRKDFGRLTGRDLAGLVTMRAEAPECFYNCLMKNLKITSFATMDMFIEALDSLRN